MMRVGLLHRSGGIAEPGYKFNEAFECGDGVRAVYARSLGGGHSLCHSLLMPECRRQYLASSDGDHGLRLNGQLLDVLLDHDVCTGVVLRFAEHTILAEQL